MAETNTAPVSPGSAKRGSGDLRSRFDLLSFISTYGVFITLVACIVIFSVLDSDFIEIDNLRTQLGLAAPLLMLSLGLTVVLAMGDFDLSIAGTLSACAAAIVVLIVNHDWPWGLAVLVGIAFGLGIGAINGLLVSYVEMPSFITTLATFLILLGVEYMISDGRNITGAADMPDLYRDLGIGKPEPFTEFTSPVWIAAGLAIILWLMMSKTELGRYMYAIGGNPEAARLSGINVKALRALGFVVVGFVAVIAAVSQTARTASSIPRVGISLLLSAYAAAFLGAAASRKGLFNVPGTVLGVIFLQAVQSGLTILGYDRDILDISRGSILVLAMLLTALGARRR